MTEHEMDDDVLAPFEEEQAAIREARERDRLRAFLEEKAREHHVAPRIETGRRTGGSRAIVLVRSDPPGDARSTTVWFSDAEWALIERRVLSSYGLQPEVHGLTLPEET